MTVRTKCRSGGQWPAPHGPERAQSHPVSLPNPPNLAMRILAWQCRLSSERRPTATRVHSPWLLNRDGWVWEPNFVAMRFCPGRSPARPCSTGPHSRHHQPLAPWNCFKIQGRSSLNPSPLLAFQKKSLVMGQGSFPSLPFPWRGKTIFFRECFTL